MIEWEPHVQVGGTIPNAFWKKLNQFGIEAGVGKENGTRLQQDSPEHYFIQGLAEGGYETGHKLDAALTKFGAIFVFKGD